MHASSKQGFGQDAWKNRHVRLIGEMAPMLLEGEAGQVGYRIDRELLAQRRSRDQVLDSRDMVITDQQAEG